MNDLQVNTMISPLQRYFAQRVKNLFNHLHDFELTSSENSLHDFRIEIKKLKAIIKFLKSIYPKQKLKKPSHLLRGIFQEAGAIREYQIMQQWLQKQELKNIRDHFFAVEKMDEMIFVFHQKSALYKADLKEIIDACGKFIQTTNPILAEQYLVELKANIEKMIHHPIDSKDWHELRKLIKQWMYASNWIYDEDEHKQDSLFSFYNKLQEAIGNWHDIEVIKDSFTQKQIYLSADLAIQKEFSKAWDKINQSSRNRGKLVEEMLMQALNLTD